MSRMRWLQRAGGVLGAVAAWLSLVCGAAEPITDEAEVRDYLAPYKLGRPILAPSGEPGAFDRLAVDHARLFRHKGRIYMMYIGFDGVGYQTALASTTDMLHWTKHGVVFARGQSKNGWDMNGRAISCFLQENDLYGSRELIKKDGKYWLLYHAYPGKGYEAGGAANGLAWTTDENLLDWHCLDKPVFQKSPDAESWDGGGPGAQEGVAVSPDGLSWRSYAQPVVPIGKPGEIDSIHAHKGAAIWHDGKLWLVYCAVRPLKDEAERAKFQDEGLERAPLPHARAQRAVHGSGNRKPEMRHGRGGIC